MSTKRITADEEEDLLFYAKERNDEGDLEPLVDHYIVSKQKSTTCPLTILFYLVGFTFYALTWVLAYQSAIYVPNVSDREIPADEFSEERARFALNGLAVIGPRVVGTPSNELNTPAYFLSRISNIKPNSHGIQLNISEQKHVSGAFGGYFSPSLITAYSNITNVVVRVSGTPESEKNALLISAHYDSVPFSPGAGDDATACAVMLELIRTLVNQDPSLFENSSVIFNFNGAEEVGLSGAHAFISSHPWATSVRAFINIDSMGAGGKAFLFQTGPNNNWLTESYQRSAPYPFGNIVGQDLFQMGAIPSDTDFRIYRDFGFVPGLDMAFINNGYVYHTYRDRLGEIDKGALQQLGQNVLAITKDLLSKKILIDTTSHSNGSSVFYDFLGWGMVNYTSDDSLWINTASFIYTALLFLLFIILAMCWKGFTKTELFKVIFYVFLSFVVLIVNWIFGLGIPVFIGFILSYINPSSWYAHPAFAFALYGFFSATGPLLVQWGFRVWIRKQMPDLTSANLQQYGFWAGHIFWMILLIIGTISRLGSTVFAFYWTIFPISVLLFFASINELLEVKKNSLPQKLHQFLPFDFWWVAGIIGQLVPVTILAYAVNLLLIVFIPLTGRIPTTRSDILIALLVAVFVQLFGTLFYPYTYRVGNFGKTVSVFGFGCLVVFFVACFLFPYSPENPLRINAIHTFDMTNNKSTIEINFLSSPPYSKALKNVQGAARIGGNWLVPEVEPPNFPLPYVDYNQTLGPCVAVTIHTFNATSFVLKVNPNQPLTSVLISGKVIQNLVRDSNGIYHINYQLGFQSWESYASSTIRFGFDTETMNKTGVVINADLEVRYAVSTIPLDNVIKQLPSWTAQTSKYLTRVLSPHSFIVGSSQVQGISCDP